MGYEDLDNIDTPIKRYIYLREKYDTFVYRGYRIAFMPESYHVEYDFEIEGLSEFTAKWDFPVFSSKEDIDDSAFGRLLFQLGMVEAISYYKITCPRHFKVMLSDDMAEYALTQDQCLWWRKLLYCGLGEFMYRNGIDVKEEELVDITCATGNGSVESGTKRSGIDGGKTAAVKPYHDSRSYAGCLVPVGGGKDSVVSLELLKDMDVITYSVNGNETTRNVIDICDHKKGDYVARRVLDKRMLELNALGYLNGHTPFSAIVAFSSVIAAYITGRKYITLSNESSANESTVKDSFVNHQYSKSYEFECDFNAYIKDITDSDIHYFSLLRPLTELQIAAVFSKAKKYHKAFRSCNVGSKKGIWCCNCPKCLFVYIILSPFLSDDELTAIFGERLLDKESLDKDFKELIGIDENKPFECVGTRREVAAAMKYYRARGGRSLLTDRYSHFIDMQTGNVKDMLTEWTDEHMVPAELANRVRTAVDSVEILK